MRPLAPLITAVIGLCITTLVLVSATARFRVVDTQLLENLDFADGSARWAGSRGGVRVLDGAPPEIVLVGRGAAAPAYVSRRFVKPDGAYDHLRVSLDLRSDALTPGPEQWQRGRVSLLSYNQHRQRMWYWPQLVATLEGSNAWRRYSATIPLSDEIRTMWLVAHVATDSGSMRLRNLRIEGVSESPLFTVSRHLAALGWAGAWLWLAASVAGRSGRTPSRLLTLAAGSALIVLSLTPQPQLRDTAWAARSAILELASDLRDSLPTSHVPSGAGHQSTGRQHASQSATESAQSARQDTRASKPANSAGRDDEAREAKASAANRPAWIPAWVESDKRGHLLAFALLGVLAAFAYRQFPLAWICASLLLLSAGIQAMQGLTVTREPSVHDLLYDGIGILLGALAVRAGAWSAGRLGAQRSRTVRAPP